MQYIMLLIFVDFSRTGFYGEGRCEGSCAASISGGCCHVLGTDHAEETISGEDPHRPLMLARRWS